MIRFAPLLLVLLLAGCVSASKWNPLSAWFGRKAAAAEKAEVKTVQVEDSLVFAAQIETFKTGLALNAALVAYPTDVALLVAKRTNDNANALLNQRSPLPVKDVDAAREIVAGLLTRTEAAEKRQQEAEGDNRKLSEELGALRERLKELDADRKREAADNLVLANELRMSKLYQYAGMAGSALLGVLAIAYKLNIGRLQTGLGEVLASVQQKHGTDAANAARSVAGVVLHSGEQKGVFKVFSALTADKAGA